jgi:hypothetical protein
VSRPALDDAHADRCAYCGATDPDVMLDKQIDLHLCGWCWFHTSPHTPPRPPKRYRRDGDCESAA